MERDENLRRKKRKSQHIQYRLSLSLVPGCFSSLLGKDVLE